MVSIVSNQPLQTTDIHIILHRHVVIVIKHPFDEVRGVISLPVVTKGDVLVNDG